MPDFIHKLSAPRLRRFYEGFLTITTSASATSQKAHRFFRHPPGQPYKKPTCAGAEIFGLVVCENRRQHNHTKLIASLLQAEARARPRRDSCT